MQMDLVESDRFICHKSFYKKMPFFFFSLKEVCRCVQRAHFKTKLQEMCMYYCSLTFCNLQLVSFTVTVNKE